MDDASFDEWLAFNSLEPLDPAGAILMGLSSKPEEHSDESSWQKQLSTMRLLGELQKAKK